MALFAKGQSGNRAGAVLPALALLGVSLGDDTSQMVGSAASRGR